MQATRAAREPRTNPEWRLTEEDVAPARGDGLDLLERLLWAGGRQIRAAHETGADVDSLPGQIELWIELLRRYERACSGLFPIATRRARTRSEGRQLDLLATAPPA